MGVLPSGGDAALRRMLFARYVERMLDRREEYLRYGHGQTLRWLGGLGRQVRRQGQSVYSI